MNNCLASISLIISVLLLGACGGGSGTAAGTDPESSSGFVTVSVGDNDINDFDQAIFVISQVVLLGDSGQIVLLDEQRTIDFLALETVNEVLAEAQVPAGQYSKVRMAVDSIELVKLDQNGDVEESVDVSLVANGKVDIVPRGEFFVAADSSLALDIDIDLEKSIKLTLTGSGRYIFRPVIFADIITDINDGRIVRVEGEFEAIQVEGVRRDDRFRICAPELMSDNDQVVESQSCRLVLVDVETGFFEAGQSLTATTLDSYLNGDNVVVYGLLNPAAYEHDNSEHYGTPIAALVAAKGEFRHLEGEAASVFDETNEMFDITLAPGQGIIGDLQLSTLLPLGEGALLVDSEGHVVETSVIASGLEVEVEGLLFLGSPNSFEAFVAIVDAEPEQISVTGMATEIDIVAQTLTLSDGVNVYCVQVSDDTDIQLVEATEESTSVNSISLETLLNAEIEVTGTIDAVSGCLVADSIILDVSPIL